MCDGKIVASLIGAVRGVISLTHRSWPHPKGHRKSLLSLTHRSWLRPRGHCESSRGTARTCGATSSYLGSAVAVACSKELVIQIKTKVTDSCSSRLQQGHSFRPGVTIGTRVNSLRMEAVVQRRREELRHTICFIFHRSYR